VVPQKNSDGLAADALHDVPLNSLLGCKLDRPTCATCGWVRAHHRYDLDALLVREKPRCPLASGLVHGMLQATFFVSTTNTTNGGFARTGGSGDIGRSPALVEELKDSHSLEHTSFDPTA
jgi:hypothetical protein